MPVTRREPVDEFRNTGSTSIAGFPRVLLVPDGHLHLALRLPRLLHRAGFKVDLLCREGELLASSRFVDTALTENSDDELFRRLREILRSDDGRWRKVIVADEILVRRLIGLGDRLLLANWQPGALDPLVGRFFLNKFGLAEIAAEACLSVPPGRICRTVEEIVDFGRNAGWPIIVKPPDGSGGMGIVRHDSAATVETGNPVELPVLAQKFIHGREGVVEMFCSGGKVLAWLCSFPTRKICGGFSHSTARRFIAVPELAPLVEQVASFTKFEGFCGFDWIEDEETGVKYLIEFHPRASSGLRFASDCGVDFSAAFAEAMNGEATSAGAGIQSGTLSAHAFPSDLYRCFRNRDWRGLRMWLPLSGVRHDVFWDDLPFLKSWGIARIREHFTR